MKASQQDVNALFASINRLPWRLRWTAIVVLNVVPRLPICALRPTMVLMAYVTGRANGRCFRLERLAWRAYRQGNYDQAHALSSEWLDLAEQMKVDRRRPTLDYGGAVHDGHQIMGLVCLRSGNVREAVQHLLAAGYTPGSPTLNSFGPSLELPKELLRHGQQDAVIEYLKLLRGFWASPKSSRSRRLVVRKRLLIKQWIAAIKKGEVPSDEYWQYRET